MKAKANDPAARPASARANSRLAYTWHLRPPFNELFCADHWWESAPSAKVDSVAALYELARRHPRIGELRQKHLNEFWHGRELGLPLTGAEKKKWATTAY